MDNSDGSKNKEKNALKKWKENEEKELKKEFEGYKKLLEYDDNEVKRILGEQRYVEIIEFVQKRFNELKTETKHPYIEEVLSIEINRKFFKAKEDSTISLGYEAIYEDICHFFKNEKYFSNINWNIKENADKIFLNTFNRYSYYRFFKGIFFSEKIIDSEFFRRNLFSANYFRNENIVYNNIDWTKYVYTEYVKKIMDYNVNNLCYSLPKEVLYLIYNEFESYKGFSSKFSSNLELEESKKTREENKLYKFIYKDIISGRGFDNIGNLIWNLFQEKSKEQIQEEKDYFEKYMVEYTTGVFTSWKIYSICYELLKKSKGETKTEKTLKGQKVGKIEKAIYDLVHEVGKIRNLEFRLYIIDNIIKKNITEVEKYDIEQIKDKIVNIRNNVNRIVEEFNRLYRILFSYILYVFENIEYRESLEWGKNTTTKYFY